MKETSERNNLEDQLADFTDQVLAGKIEKIDSEVNDELRYLEETILRLKRAIPHTPLDAITIKRMQSNLKARLRSEEERTKVNFWQKWFRAHRSHPKFAFTISAVIVLIFVSFIAPYLTQPEPAMTAVATSPSLSAIIVSVLSGIILLVIWINHRK